MSRTVRSAQRSSSPTRRVREAFLTCRLSASEQLLLTALAEAAGISRSAYLRRMLLREAGRDLSATATQDAGAAA